MYTAYLLCVGIMLYGILCVRRGQCHTAADVYVGTFARAVYVVHSMHEMSARAFDKTADVHRQQTVPERRRRRRRHEDEPTT